MIGNAALFTWLALVWVFLWGDPSAGTALAGAAISAGVMVTTRGTRATTHGTVRPLPTLRFLGYFLYKLLEASAVVAWEVVTPSNRINQGIVAVDIDDDLSDALVTVIANAITLTPGTLTVDVRRKPNVLYVHVLHLRSVEQTRREVLELQRDVVRAFGTKMRPEAAA